MNPPSTRHSPALDKQAALWAARLDGSVLSASYRIALDDWLATNPVHRELLSHYCQFSADLEQQLPSLVTAGKVTLPAAKIYRPAWYKWAVAAALATAATVAIALILRWPASNIQIASIGTPVAQRQTLTLVDGSRIELDARTSLRIEIDDTARRVRLAEGQAYFSISKDAARPFTVETPAGAIRVRGTQFDVQSFRDDTLIVTVTEGKVQVSPAATSDGTAPVSLTVGDQFVLNGAKAVTRRLSRSELEDTLAWRSGYIVFDGVPLEAALKRFSRHHGIGITCAPDVAALRIGGRFPLDDLSGFFVALEEVLPVRVSRGTNGAVRVARRD